MLVAVGIALYYGFLLSDVVVMGNDEFSADYIVELSGLKLGTHMLFVDLDQAEENIAENPYLQVDSVTYIFPSRVRIVVSERKEVAGIVGLDSTLSSTKTVTCSP
jgi:cell division septal protein FtsQ